jgi:hypothetical protein
MDDVVLATGIILIALPIAFNLAFFELGRVFDYPGILRQPTPVILTRFAAGGSGLILRWWLFMLLALALLPMAVLVGVVLGSAPAALVPIGIAVGVAASIVQVIGLIRWPFVVPELARRYAAAEDGPAGDATRATIEVAFATLHRLLGVAIGEHLGYLMTGAWTMLVGAAMLGPSVVPAWLGAIGLVIGLALVVGSLEFVGPNEEHGWAFAEKLVPIAYIAWSLWLVFFGVLLVLG